MGRLVASVSSNEAPAELASPTGSTFTNFSPMFTTAMPLSASTACSASMASVLVSGVCVFKMICAPGTAPRINVRFTSCA